MACQSLRRRRPGWARTTSSSPGLAISAVGKLMIGPAFRGLLAAAIAGDEEAFATLWRDVQPRLLRYLAVVNPSAAEDLAAATWLEVVGNLARFDGDEGEFRSWVFATARRRSIDRHRRAGRPADQPVPLGSLAGDPASDPAAAAVGARSSQAAVAVIATLPAEEAEVLLLRVVADLEVAQVARITGKRPDTVRALAKRGLQQLAERLGPDHQQRPGARLAR